MSNLYLRQINASRPHPKPTFPSSKLRFECRDLNHSGAATFFAHNNPAHSLSCAADSVLSTLYAPTKTNENIPSTRSITLVLRSMGGVAYTTGTELDDEHKEIHFSLEYIDGISSRTPGRDAHEIQGVLVHEMVHAWQWNAIGTAPGGLIEGIADFVRLKAGLSPPHWRKEAGEKWDAGYQYTGYFLEWIEDKWGEGSVRKINATLKGEKYEEDVFWDKLFGEKVQDLWEKYKASLESKKGKMEDDTAKEKTEEEFWLWVKEKKGAEQTIVMKAIWRTRKHMKKALSNDGLAKEVERLWTEYFGTHDGQTEKGQEKAQHESDEDEAVLVEKEDSVKESEKEQAPESSKGKGQEA